MSLSENDGKQELKEIIKNEDNNLYARTNFFLVVNGILFAALSVSKTQLMQVCVGIVGMIVSIFLILCTWQSQRVITALHARFKDKYPSPDGDEYYYVIEKALLKKWLRPAELLGIILPILVIVSWFIYSSWFFFS